jgi:hypothetical protein
MPILAYFPVISCRDGFASDWAHRQIPKDMSNYQVQLA